MKLMFKTLIVALLAAPAVAQEAEKSPLEIKGQVFMSVLYDDTEGSKKRGLDVDRSYLTLNYRYDEIWSLRVQTDVARTSTARSVSTAASPTTTQFETYDVIYLRNVYLEGKGLAGGGVFRIGYQPTQYVSILEGNIKTRWMGRTMLDQVYASTAMIRHAGGVSWTQPLGSAVDFFVFAHNGKEALNQPGAADNGTALHVLLDLKFLEDKGADLRKLGLLLAHETIGRSDDAVYAPVAEDRATTAAAFYLSTVWADANLEASHTKTPSMAEASTGTGLSVNVKFEGWSLFGRHFTGNEGFRRDLGRYESLSTVGPSFSIVKDKLETALLYEVSRNDGTLNPNGADKKTYWWRWIANF